MSMEEIIEKKMEEVTQGTEPAEEQEETIERPFTLRKLKDADLFPLLKIFRKCGLKDFKDVLQQRARTGTAVAYNEFRAPSACISARAGLK